jgi:CRP-like cAMP-binding protein
VVSLGYNNIAQLSKRGFIDICDKFPHFIDVVKKCNYKYKDKRKLFMIKLVKSVEYFEDEPAEIMHQLIYKMKPVFKEKGASIVQQNEFLEKIIFVERGQIEIYAEFEGNEFVIERLGPGAVINQKAFFVNDKIQVNMRTGMNTDMYELDKKTLDEIRIKHPEFDKKLSSVENNFLKEDK